MKKRIKLGLAIDDEVMDYNISQLRAAQYSNLSPKFKLTIDEVLLKYHELRSELYKVRAGKSSVSELAILSKLDQLNNKVIGIPGVRLESCGKTNTVKSGLVNLIKNLLE